MGITQVKPEIQEKLYPLMKMREDVFNKIKEHMVKLVWVNAVQRVNKFEISQIFDISVKQAGLIEYIFNPKIKRSKQPDQLKGQGEPQIPALSESKLSNLSSNRKPPAKIGPVINKPTDIVYNSIDTTELLMTVIFFSDHMDAKEKWKECLSIINADMFSYLTYAELKLVFRYCYAIIKHLTDLNISSCDLETYIYDNYIFAGQEYYKDTKVDMEELVTKITHHSDYKEFIKVMSSTSQLASGKEEKKEGQFSTSNKKQPSSTRKPKPGDFDAAQSKFSFSKNIDGFKGALRQNDEDITSIQELQSDKSGKRQSAMDSVKSISPMTKRARESVNLPKIQTSIKEKREEEDQVSRIRQIQYENAQIHFEGIRFEIERKILLKSEEHTNFLLRYMKLLKLKVQDSFLISVIPAVVDSIMFEEDLKNRDVSLISESLITIIRKVPKSPRAEEREEGELLSNRRNPSNIEVKEESKTAFEDEEMTIVDEKRLQILTSITFRDLFQKKVRMFEMRKKELFQKSLVYIDYDVVKITNMKNKSLLVGWIHEVQKAFNKIQIGNVNDDTSSLNNDGTKKLTASFLQDKAVYLYEKILKLNLQKSDVTGYKLQTQNIKELLAFKCFYQGCKEILKEVSNLRVFDGIPLLIDYQDYVNGKDNDGYKTAQKMRQEWKDKILKYMTLVGRLKGVQFVLKSFENAETVQRETVSEFLQSCKQELETTNETLISECLYKAYKLRNILKEYYNIVGQLAIWDSIQKQLQPFYLPAYFKLSWFIDSWNILLLSIVEKEKISILNSEQKSTPRGAPASPSKPTSKLTSMGSIKKVSSKPSGANHLQNLTKLNTLTNKLQAILRLLKEWEKYGVDRVKEDCNGYLEDEENELLLLEKVYKTCENFDRKSRSSITRRKSSELRTDNSHSRHGITKEQLTNEQYSCFSTSDKIKKLSNYIEADFQNTEIDHTRIVSFLETRKSELFDSRELQRGSDIDYEIYSFFTEPEIALEFNVIHKTLGKNPEEEAIVFLNKTYNIKHDPDLDLKIILDRKTKYHKEMVKFFKLLQQTRARKLTDFLVESRNSCLSEFATLNSNMNNELFIPVYSFKNMEDIYYSIYLINDFIENERRHIETDEVTPPVIDDTSENEDLSSAAVHYDPEHIQLVGKYHKMEKNVARLFNETELFQAPFHLLSCILNQENALKNEYTKLLSSWDNEPPADSLKGGFKKGANSEKQLDEEIEHAEMLRLDHLEERLQLMVEHMIAKGTWTFLEQSENRNLLLKRLAKSMRILRDKQKPSKDEDGKHGLGTGTPTGAEQLYLQFFKYAGKIRKKVWKESRVFEFDEESDASIIKREISTRLSNSKVVTAKIQTIVEILEQNLTAEFKQQRESLLLKSEGVKLIYEILIGKSFEVDAFEIKDPELQKLRSEHALSSDSLLKKSEIKGKEKAFINIFKPQEGASGPVNTINLKKIPLKAIKKVAPTQKQTKLQKFVMEAFLHSNSLLSDETALQALNHLFNYHYLLCHLSFKIRGLLSLTEDALFTYTSYKCEELEFHRSQTYILKQLQNNLSTNLLQIYDTNTSHLFSSYTLSTPTSQIATRLETFMYARLTSVGVVAVREYQRALEASFRMLQVEPEERAEVDSAVKKVTRKVQRAVGKFVDMLDMGDASSDDRGMAKGLHGTERMNAYYEEQEEKENLKVVQKLADLNALFMYHFTKMDSGV